MAPSIWWPAFASLIPSLEPRRESAFTPKPGIDVEQEQTELNREKTWIRKALKQAIYKRLVRNRFTLRSLL